MDGDCLGLDLWFAGNGEERAREVRQREETVRRERGNGPGSLKGVVESGVGAGSSSATVRQETRDHSVVR